MIGSCNVFKEEFSLFSKISLWNKSRCVIINIFDKIAIKINFKILSHFNHIIDSLGILSDILVVIMMVLFCQEGFNLQLMLKLKMENFSFLSKLDLNVDAMAIRKGLIKNMVIIFINSIS